jgi:radical SAM protein
MAVGGSGIADRGRLANREQAGRRQFDDRPLLVFWETTKACELSCLHCRASAQSEPSKDELTKAEGFALVDELASIGRPRPILILTGGDCLKRSEILEITAYAAERSVPVAIAPSVTPQLTSQTLKIIRSHGVKTASLSLDGASAATHDGVRGIAGHFEATLQAIDTLKQEGFTVQINTTVMPINLEELADVASLIRERGVDIWEVFFLISTGRGTGVIESTPEENEQICHFLVDASRYGFTVRTVESPFFRRVSVERRDEDAEGSAPEPRGELYDRLRSRLIELLGEPTSPVRTPSAATRDGKGIIFVASNGDVHPSGFLPLRLGNVRQEGLVQIYRDHPLLHKIRDAEFNGVCGSCTYSQLCGGSRSRSFASTGDPLGEDPGCILVANAHQ